MGQFRLSEAALRGVSRVPNIPVADVMGAYDRGYQSVQNQQMNKQKMQANEQLMDINNYKLKQAESDFISGQKSDEKSAALQKAFSEIDYGKEGWQDKVELAIIHNDPSLENIKNVNEWKQKNAKNKVEMEKLRVGLEKTKLDYKKAQQPDKKKEFAPSAGQKAIDSYVSLLPEGEREAARLELSKKLADKSVSGTEKAGEYTLPDGNKMTHTQLLSEWKAVYNIPSMLELEMAKNSDDTSKLASLEERSRIAVPFADFAKDKYGINIHIESKGKPEKSKEPSVSRVQKKFDNDPDMKGNKLGEKTKNGNEVFDKSGKLIGYYK